MRRIDIGDLFQAQTSMMSPATNSSFGNDPTTGTTGANDMGMQKTGTTQPTDQKKQKSSSSCLGGSPLTTMLPLVLMFVVFYFFLIRPQQKKQKEHQALLGGLRKGDQITTTGGILGKITGLTDQYAVIEVQEKVRIKVMRSHISGKQASGSGGSGDSKK